MALLLLLAPAVLLFAVLAAGRYPGESLLVPIGEGRWSPRFVTFAEAPARVCVSVSLLPRGGRLVAHALAVRGPPCA